MVRVVRFSRFRFRIATIDTWAPCLPFRLPSGHYRQEDCNVDDERHETSVMKGFTMLSQHYDNGYETMYDV